MRYVMIIIERGVNVNVVSGNRDALKSLPLVAGRVWQNFGYKEGCHITEYVSAELWKVRE